MIDAWLLKRSIFLKDQILSVARYLWITGKNAWLCRAATLPAARGGKKERGWS
uniref:Uncharacterized protein n=1 Tax=Aeromonas salmonicida subsp. salmonicida TaxID=29491 RepID=A0A1I9S1U9_AERSS|nr:putative hypothetical protein [Aeromonas salmonicida subsp. salmonicida]